MFRIESDLSENRLNTPVSFARQDTGFQWTDAIRPLDEYSFTPREGYRYDAFKSMAGNVDDCIQAQVSREKLFDVFLDLIDTLGDRVDVIIETSMDIEMSKGYVNHQHIDLWRSDIEAVVLKSALFEFEDLLINDGFTGIVVRNSRLWMEVQWDEDKNVTCYGKRLGEFSDILNAWGIRHVEDLKLVSDDPHWHFGKESDEEVFERLCEMIGVSRSA